MEPVSGAVIIVAVIAVIFLLLFFKILGSSLKWILKLLLNAVTGFMILFLVNIVGGIIGIGLDLNWINALVAGFFGAPGVVVLLVIKYLL